MRVLLVLLFLLCFYYLVNGMPKKYLLKVGNTDRAAKGNMRYDSTKENIGHVPAQENLRHDPTKENMICDPTN